MIQCNRIHPRWNTVPVTVEFVLPSLMAEARPNVAWSDAVVRAFAVMVSCFWAPSTHLDVSASPLASQDQSVDIACVDDAIDKVYKIRHLGPGLTVTTCPFVPLATVVSMRPSFLLLPAVSSHTTECAWHAPSVVRRKDSDSVTNFTAFRAPLSSRHPCW
jgi:hypothetical protein